MAAWLGNLLPDVEVRAAHGQMKPGELERVMVDFLENRFAVLLCTTIIESGIDMPNVNTLIVNDAHRFGLSQLYQMRGRVGRSSRQSHAWLFLPRDRDVGDDAVKRLDVLAANQELGAGFQIASHDLEIRGAGSLLGAEQSGHASDVGFDLYTEMLESAIRELRGEEVSQSLDTELKIPVAAGIPAAYISRERERLHVYKRIFAAAGEGELHALREEIEDRFGPMPAASRRVFRIAVLKNALARCRAKKFVMQGGAGALISFDSLLPAQIELLTTFQEKDPRFRLRPDFRLELSFAREGGKITGDDQILEEALTMIQPLAARMEDCTG